MLQQLGWIFSKGTTRTLKHYEVQKVQSNFRKYLMIEKRIIQSNVQKKKPTTNYVKRRWRHA